MLRKTVCHTAVAGLDVCSVRLHNSRCLITRYEISQGCSHCFNATPVLKRNHYVYVRRLIE